MERKECHDCHCKEGELHEYGCDMERCPFCGGQLISCGCVYNKLGFDYVPFYKDPFNHYPTSGLPKHIYENGLTKELEKEWVKLLNRRGRVPYIQYPNLCRKCGEQWPEMFNVSDDVLLTSCRKPNGGQRWMLKL